ncbi:MAG TPA: NAD-dependent epimerase/dehydratase family protein [Methylomirabilota bacterium]|nr:NAD-dependent epimerase/dehydratase family protein [Methylomirabilota bacterium]
MTTEAFRGLRVLVTGGLGFIGSNLARRLLTQGAAEIVLVDSLIPEYGGNLFNISGIEKDVTVNIADVRDEHSMRQLVRGKDVLFNLAGQTSHVDSMTDPYTDLEINCRAQLFILEACRRNNPGIRVVYASTRQIYGRPEYLPVDERHLLRPTDVNGINKMAGEWYHILYSNVYGVRAAALRLTNTYGPRMRIKDARQTFLGVWIRNLLRGEEIQVFGDGSQLRDFNYVDDAVEALLAAAASEQAVGQVLNLGAEPPISLKELAELLIKLNGSGRWRIVPFPEDRRAIDIGDYYADFSRAVSVLGWKPRVPLADGLQRTLDFYREFGEHYAA